MLRTWTWPDPAARRLVNLRLRDQLEAARSALDALSTENAKLRDENAILRDDNISLRRTRTKRAREKEELDAELACLKELLDELRAREASGAADEPEAAARTVTPGAPVMECGLEEWCKG